jgi:hypothetical protein
LGTICRLLEEAYSFKKITSDDDEKQRRQIRLQLSVKTGLSMNRFTRFSKDSSEDINKVIRILKAPEFGLSGFDFDKYSGITEKQYVKASSGEDIERIVKDITESDTALILVFYGIDSDEDKINRTLKNTKLNFIACRDSGRMCNSGYLLDKKTISAISFSSYIFKKIAFECIDMSEERTRDEIRSQSAEKLIKAAESISLDLNNIDMKKDFIVNILYGSTSATPVLEGQTSDSIMLQSVGGSSGGPLDFSVTNVISHLGEGKIGIFALIKLNDEFEFDIGRVSSFDKISNLQMVATKLENPRLIREFNYKPASDEYSMALFNEIKELTPELLSLYSIGIEPGDDEILVTSIVRQQPDKSLFTTNDILEGSAFNVYKSKDMLENRSKMLDSLLKKKDMIAFISFDCTWCYLARNQTCTVDSITRLYNSKLEGIPKIGFATWGEIYNGVCVNQTETYLALYKTK